MTELIPRQDYVRQQGEDSAISIVYMTGDPATAIDLTGYSVRMTAVTPDGVVVVFNSDDFDETTVDEVVLGTEGEINIVLDRSLTLPEGPLFDHIEKALAYDIFLRNSLGRQKKILRGTIMFERSATLWQ